MEHHASAGWPTAIMAQGFMAKGLHGMPYDPFAIAGADHWHSVGVQRVRALSNDVANSAFRPGWLALDRASGEQNDPRRRRHCRHPRAVPRHPAGAGAGRDQTDQPLAEILRLVHAAIRAADGEIDFKLYHRALLPRSAGPRTKRKSCAAALVDTGSAADRPVPLK
jgi:hypothetical protein